MKRRDCPARYEKFFVARMDAALAEIARDMEYRADAEPRIRAFALIPEKMIDGRRTGELLIVVGEVEEPRAKMERVS